MEENTVTVIFYRKRIGQKAYLYSEPIRLYWKLSPDNVIINRSPFGKNDSTGGLKMKKETLKQQAYNIIKNKIITCEYPPNFLLNEEKLKDEIGDSYQRCAEQIGTGKSCSYSAEERDHGRFIIDPRN